MNIFAFVDSNFILGVVCVVTLSELTKDLLSSLEEFLEEKKGKQIKFFDHTKIIISIFYSLLVTVCLVLANVYTWNQFPIYTFAILGVSTACYELVLKKLKGFVEK